ncbi:MAG TPA: phage tail protein, partial [Gemmatimonadales bacterium]|nr:phage tail protein [Gemmatimonadales bacterium]
MAGVVVHPLATDPLRNFKFRFTITSKAQSIPGIAQLGFMAVTGLSANTPAINYREGGNNTTTRKMPGQTEFPAITCQRGVAVGSGALWQWYIEIFHVVQGGGRGFAGNDFRSDMVLDVLDHPVSLGPTPIKARFQIFNGWPSAIQFSDFDAGGNALLMENMTI